MPGLEDLKPFLVLGLALGGVFAMSGVGLVVLYRATGCSTWPTAPSAPCAP